MKKNIAKFIVILTIVNPLYVNAGLDLSIPSEDLAVALNDSVSSAAHSTSGRLLDNTYQSDFTVGSGRSSPAMIIAVIVVIALVAIQVNNNVER